MSGTYCPACGEPCAADAVKRIRAELAPRRALTKAEDRIAELERANALLLPLARIVEAIDAASWETMRSHVLSDSEKAALAAARCGGVLPTRSTHG
jgi:hypothetical protein